MKSKREPRVDRPPRSDDDSPKRPRRAPSPDHEKPARDSHRNERESRPSRGSKHNERHDNNVERSRGDDKGPRKERASEGEGTGTEKVRKGAKVDDFLTTRTGGAYIPPARLRLMQKEITDKTSPAYQRMSWEALKKSIHGLVNKVNISNIGVIVRSMLKENIVRGRGLLCRSIMQAQSASPTFTNVYAAFIAVLNSKFPTVGELILKRLIIQFRRGFKRNDKTICMTSTAFVAHLVNQHVAHEIIALEIITLLMETPTDNSIEVGISFLRECGYRLEEVAKVGLVAVFERLRHILHEGDLDKRVQYMIEVMFQVRKDKFKDNVDIVEELQLIEEEHQFTHMIMLDEATNGEDILNVFKLDPEFETNEEEYRKIRVEILDESEGSSEEGGSGSEEGSESEEDEVEKEAEAQKIIDNTETNLAVLRRTIYLTIQSSLDYEECTHKLLKMELKPGQEVELCHMILDCCAQQRTYEKFFGLLAQRFCQINQMYIAPFSQIFIDSYDTVHRLETNNLRNIAKLFAHLLYTDAISWGVLSHIKLNEEDTTSSSRIFIKILFLELSEFMGLTFLNERIKDVTLQSAFEGLFPRDSPKNTRFAINFFTSIGLGGLTDDLRDHLKNAPKPPPMLPVIEVEDAKASSDDEKSSDADSSESEEEMPSKRKKKEPKENKEKKKKGESKSKQSEEQNNRRKAIPNEHDTSKRKNNHEDKGRNEDKRRNDERRQMMIEKRRQEESDEEVEHGRKGESRRKEERRRQREPSEEENGRRQKQFSDKEHERRPLKGRNDEDKRSDVRRQMERRRQEESEEENGRRQKQFSDKEHERGPLKGRNDEDKRRSDGRRQIERRRQEESEEEVERGRRDESRRKSERRQPSDDENERRRQKCTSDDEDGRRLAKGRKSEVRNRKKREESSEEEMEDRRDDRRKRSDGGRIRKKQSSSEDEARQVKGRERYEQKQSHNDESSEDEREVQRRRRVAPREYSSEEESGRRDDKQRRRRRAESDEEVENRGRYEKRREKDSSESEVEVRRKGKDSDEGMLMLSMSQKMDDVRRRMESRKGEEKGRYEEEGRGRKYRDEESPVNTTRYRTAPDRHEDEGERRGGRERRNKRR